MFLKNPWTTTVGLARSLLALSTGVILLLNPSAFLFDLVPGGSFENLCQSKMSLFCWFPENLWIVQKLAGLILLIIATGVFPRFTGVFHWWLTYSFVVSAENINGGDQLASILTFFLIPWTLSDSRRHHWMKTACDKTQSQMLIGWVGLWLIRIQICVVYFHAAVGKFKIEEWTDGSVLYYWIIDPVFGPAEKVKNLILPILLNGRLAAFLTWSVLLTELLLAAALLSKATYRPWLFIVGFLFHTGTVVLHGIPSFALVMYAGLILYLWPLDLGLDQILAKLWKRKPAEPLAKILKFARQG